MKRMKIAVKTFNYLPFTKRGKILTLLHGTAYLQHERSFIQIRCNFNNFTY